MIVVIYILQNMLIFRDRQEMKGGCGDMMWNVFVFWKGKEEISWQILTDS